MLESEVYKLEEKKFTILRIEEKYKFLIDKMKEAVYIGTYGKKEKYESEIQRKTKSGKDKKNRGGGKNGKNKNPVS